jgi:6-phosphogluconolactonase
MQHNSRWHLLETADEVALAVYDEILEAAQEAIKRQGKFKLVLAGGSTPEKVYKLLAKSDADWARWYIY